MDYILGIGYNHFIVDMFITFTSSTQYTINQCHVPLTCQLIGSEQLIELCLYLVSSLFVYIYSKSPDVSVYSWSFRML